MADYITPWIGTGFWGLALLKNRADAPGWASALWSGRGTGGFFGAGFACFWGLFLVVAGVETLYYFFGDVKGRVEVEACALEEDGVVVVLLVVALDECVD